jgi:O-antigen/teichoic acid export membrane protein
MLNLLKRLTLQSAWYGAAMVGRQLIAFLLLPLYTHHLPAESYGIISVFMLAQLFLGILYTLGLTPAISRFAGDSQITTRFPHRRILSTALFFLLIWGGLLTFILLNSANRWAFWLFGDGALGWAVQLLAILVISDSLWSFAGIVLRLHERAGSYAILNVSQLLVQIAAAYYLIVVAGWGVRGALSAMLIASCVSGIVGLLLIRQALEGAFSLKLLKILLGYSLPLIPGLFATGILDLADRYILRLLIGLAPVGIYEAGYRIGKMVNFIIVPFSTAWPPIIYSLVGTQKSQALLARVSTYMLAASLFLATAISVFAKELTSLLTGVEYVSSSEVIPWIAFGTVAFGMANLFQTGLHIAKRTDLISAITVIFAIATIALCLLTIPSWGILGAAVTTFLTFSGLAIVTLWFSRRFFPAPFEYVRMLKLLVLAGAALLVSRIISQPEFAAANLFIKGVALALFPVGIFLLRMPDNAEMQTFARAFRSLKSRVVSFRTKAIRLVK